MTKQEIPIEEYVNSSKHYDLMLNPFLNHIRKATARWIIKNQPKKIIDVGCGTGKQISLLPKNMDITGVDISEHMLKVAKKQAPNKCIQADAIELPFDDNKFDLAISQFALHEKDFETIKKESTEILRILKPNGKFLIVDFDYPKKGQFLSQIFKKAIHLIEKNAGDEHYINFKSWMKKGGLEKVISQLGWRLIEEQSFLKGNVSLTIWEK